MFLQQIRNLSLLFAESDDSDDRYNDADGCGFFGPRQMSLGHLHLAQTDESGPIGPDR